MKPIDEFIPREINNDLSKLLNQLANGIDELVNFGSNIVSWDLERDNGSDEDLPPLLFLRNFIEEIDAISILIRNSSIDPCNNLLRTALENLFYVSYILEKDTFNRSMAFLVWNAINNRKNALKADGKSEQYKNLLRVYKKDILLKNSSPIVMKGLEEFFKNSDKLLNLTKYKPIKEEYDRTKTIIKNPPWYSLFSGPKNLENLAQQLNYPALYEILFRGWSSSSHGTDIIQGKLAVANDNQAEIFQIRYPKDAQQVTQHCFNLSILLFRVYMDEKLQSKQSIFNEWYLSLRKFILTLGEKELIIIE